jgi:phosphoglycerate dehydrogenase-like enzyme
VQFVCPDGEPAYRQILDPSQLARLRESHDLRWFDSAPNTKADWIQRLDGAEGVLLLWALPPGVLTESPGVKVISYVGTGVERYVDLAEARKCGVTVCNVPSYGANAVAEHALALMLAVARRIPAGDRLIRAGGWQQDEGLELGGRRLGVVGVGPIGRRMIEIGLGLGMSVVAWTRTPTPERSAALGVAFSSLEDLFASCDFVSLHLAHRPQTEGMITGQLLNLLLPHAVLVNTARAELIDMETLRRLLEQRRFFGAGLDVFDEEPPAKDSFLLTCPYVVLTPHVGFRTANASQELFRIGIENLVAFAEGRRQNVVDHSRNL